MAGKELSPGKLESAPTYEKFIRISIRVRVIIVYTWRETEHHGIHPNGKERSSGEDKRSPRKEKREKKPSEKCVEG